MYPAALQPTLALYDPLYWGLRNNWLPQTTSVSRTGYNERDLVDYGAMNFKFTAGLHYKITPVLKHHGILTGVQGLQFILVLIVILFAISKWLSINLKYVIRTGLFVVIPHRKMPEKLTRQQPLDV
jgi:hypothetical protein